MRILITITIAILISTGVFAQTICFGYDLAGNRTSRTICLKSTEASIDSAAISPPATDQVGDYQIKLWPNPTLGLVTIAITGESELTGYMVLSDLNGKIIIKQETLQPTNSFNLTPYPRGMYVLLIHAGQKESVWKIIKE